MKLANKIVDTAIRYDVIEEEERDTYTVATSLLLFSFLTWGTLIIMGILFKQITGCLVFLIFHLPIRIFAGGFHQKTRTRCYAQSCVIFLILLYGAKTILYTWIVENWIVLIVISFLTIWFLAPVEAANKPLSKEEHQRYRLIARVLLILEIVIETIFLYNRQYSMLYYSSVSIILAAFHLITGVACSHSTRRDILIQ